MTYQTTILASIVVSIGFMVMLILGLGLVGRLDAQSTPLIVSLFGAIIPTIAALVSILRTDRSIELTKVVNGDITSLTARMDIADPAGASEP